MGPHGGCSGRRTPWPAATVAFLGALTVVVCPSLEATLDGRKLGFSDAPQVWLAAGLALAGVAVLELSDLLAPGAAAGSFAGDAWSVLQAVGFGTSFYLIERMMAGQAESSDQVCGSSQTMCGLHASICMHLSLYIYI